MKKRVLIVDDEMDVLELLEDVLDSDFETVTAPSAAQGLELLARDPTIVLAIVDYMMPGGDGLTMVRGLQEQKRDFPVILYTAYLDSQPSDWTGGIRLRILSKSEPPETLMTAIRELLASGPPEN